MVDYITNEDTIIFSPYYNGLIDTNLLSEYNKIIFSNYKLDYNSFENYKKLDFKNCKLIGSKFNQKVELPENLTHLTFGKNFNQKVELPLSIKYLKLENDTMHNLDYLPEGIEVLELGEYLNDDSLCNLPNSLKIIKLNKNHNYNGNIKCLPTNTKIEYYS